MANSKQEIEIPQDVIINRLNRYLEWNHLPLKMDEGGICQGLSAVFCKYTLEGQQAELLEILKNIASMNPETEHNLSAEDRSAIDRFIVEIVLSFVPTDFNKDLTQQNSIEGLSIKGEKLKSSFDFGIMTSDENWVKIIKEINLRKDEVFLFNGMNHAVSVSRTPELRWIIYDPNYTDGVKYVDTEEALVTELYSNCFSPQVKERVSMSLQVIGNPANAVVDRKDLGESLFNTYFNSNIHLRIQQGYSVKRDDNYIAAIKMNRRDIIDLYYTEDKLFLEYASKAVFYNSPDALTALLSKITHKDNINQLPNLFFHILNSGRKNILDVFLNDKNGQLWFKRIQEDPQNFGPYIKEAARGGNKEIMEQIMGYFTNLPINKLAENILKKSGDDNQNALEAAINGSGPHSSIRTGYYGSCACVSLLLEQLKKADRLDDNLLKDCLIQAVKANNPQIVDLLVDKISQRENASILFQSIQIKAENFDGIDKSILDRLISYNITLSELPKNEELKHENSLSDFFLTIDTRLVPYQHLILG